MKFSGREKAALAGTVLFLAVTGACLVPRGDSGTPYQTAEHLLWTEEVGARGQENSDEGLININTADEETLDTLPGIGPARAAAIVADREANGPFRIPEDITRVSGIGPGILEDILEYITVD